MMSQNRTKLEEPLIKIDKALEDFAALNKAHFLKNYRDGVNRNVYWISNGLLKYIQIKLVDEKKAIYEVIASAYRIHIPIINFWNLYLDFYKQWFKKIDTIEAPIDLGNLIKKINEGKIILDSLNKKNVRRNELNDKAG